MLYMFLHIKGFPIKKSNAKASCHVQNATSLEELQQLGGWASLEMVLRYAHLSSKHLKSAADRLSNLVLGV